MEKVQLTKEEFIKRAMNGERFRFEGREYFYDSSFANPFRTKITGMSTSWEDINGENEFEVEDESI